MIALRPKGRMRLRSTPLSRSNTLPCQANRLISFEITGVKAVPGAMIAVPSVVPFGMSPAGTLEYSASSSDWLICMSFSTS
jgi:hypothetical protein